MLNTQSDPLRVDIISDVVCPWCVIGYKQLERAIEREGLTGQVEIHWHPFELNRHMPPEGQDLREHLVEKYRSTPAQSRAIRTRISDLGDALGFTFAWSDTMRIYNTFEAHQLIHWAHGQGKGTAMKLALFEAYFSRHENISDRQVLSDIADRAGLPRSEAGTTLESQQFANDVRSAEAVWTGRGIHSVPASIFAGKYLVSGGQDSSVFAQALRRMVDGAAEAAPAPDAR